MVVCIYMCRCKWWGNNISTSKYTWKLCKWIAGINNIQIAELLLFDVLLMWAIFPSAAQNWDAHFYKLCYGWIYQWEHLFISCLSCQNYQYLRVTWFEFIYTGKRVCKAALKLYSIDWYNYIPWFIIGLVLSIISANITFEKNVL